jgi:hypothetical protein
MKLLASYWQATPKRAANPRSYSGYGCYATSRLRAHNAKTPSHTHQRIARVTRSVRSLSSINGLQAFCRRRARSLSVAAREKPA